MPDIRIWRGTRTTMATRCRGRTDERSPEPGGSRDQSTMLRSGVGTLAVVGSLLLASATLAAGLAHDLLLLIETNRPGGQQPSSQTHGDAGNRPTSRGLLSLLRRCNAGEVRQSPVNR